jgi:hypothetical protein
LPAKSSTVNNWNQAANNPPYKANINALTSIDATAPGVNAATIKIETIIRALGIVGQCERLEALASSKMLITSRRL